jgi:hypothetical protein
MPQSTTLIDVLGEGYRTINRRPLLVALPMLVNIYLLFGAQISFAPLFDQIGRLMQRMQPAADTSDISAAESIAILARMDMRLPLAVLNTIPTLPVTALAVDVPGAVAAPLFARPTALTVESIGGALLVFLLVNTLALPLSALFLTRVTAAVQNERVTLAAWVRSAAQVGLSILGAALVMAGVGLALALPFVVFASLLMILNQGVGLFALSLLVLATFWVQVYFGFAHEAILLGRRNPLRALQASFQVVRRHFWGTLGLLALSYIISAGSAVIWSSLLGSAVGLVVAVLGSAYIGCGLQAARLAFLRDRLKPELSRT